MILLQTLRRLLGDSGPIYTETQPDRWIVEPFNAASAFLFVLIVGYWLLRLRGQYRQHLFLSVSVGVLAIGGIGGTLYHAFRTSEVFLVMDWLPILLLCVAASGYFLYRATRSWAITLGFIVMAFVLDALSSFITPRRLSINLNYVFMGLTVLIPTALVLIRTNFRSAGWVITALLAFGVALLFRVADPWGWLPMGTHFLWHTFGAVACFSMFAYVYHLNASNPNRQPMPQSRWSVPFARKGRQPQRSA